MYDRMCKGMPEQRIIGLAFIECKYCFHKFLLDDAHGSGHVRNIYLYKCVINV